LNVASKKVQYGPWLPVQTTLEGQSYEGQYRVERTLVRVQYNFYEKCANLGGLPADTIARVVLGEMVREHPYPRGS
jgi:hypothetical protein